MLQHVRTCKSVFLYLRNYWVDCAHIWHVARNQRVRWLTHVHVYAWVGCHSARAHVQLHTLFLYLGNDWTDCSDIWHVANDQLVMWIVASTRPQCRGGVLQHVRTCKGDFYISGTAGPIALKFGMSVETDEVGDLRTFVWERLCTCARAYPASISPERPNRLFFRSLVHRR